MNTTFDLASVIGTERMSQIDRDIIIKSLSKGDLLFFEGKSPTGVYYLHAGKFKLFTTDAQGREQIVHLAKPGDLMGYRAVLGSDTYSCTAEAIEHSEVWFIPKDIFLHLIEENAALSHAVIKLLTAELRHAEHHLAGLARKPVKSRLAEALLLLADTYGFENDGQTLAVQLTREEIAGLVGTATETAIRLIQQLKDDGMLATDNRKTRLIDVPALRRLADEV